VSYSKLYIAIEPHVRVPCCISRYASKVVLTDIGSDVLQNLRHNVEQARTEQGPLPVVIRECKHAEVAHRDEGLLAACGGTIDLLLGSDLVYSSGCIPGVVDALTHFLRPRNVAGWRPPSVVLVNPDRRRGVMDGSFLEALREAGLQCKTCSLVLEEPSAPGICTGPSDLEPPSTETLERGSEATTLCIETAHYVGGKMMFKWDLSFLDGVHTMFGMDDDETFTAYHIWRGQPSQPGAVSTEAGQPSNGSSRPSKRAKTGVQD